MLRLTKPSAMGPKPNFSDADVYWAMFYLNQGKRVCRKALADMLDVGEGTVRTILAILRDADMLDTYQTGNILNKLGRSFMDMLPITPVEADVPRLSVGPLRQALLVRGAAGSITNGWDQRDIGLIAGGNGCSTVVCLNGHLLLPPAWNLDRECPDEAAAIRSAVDIHDNDVLVIGSGNSMADARRAAVSVALSIL